MAHGAARAAYDPDRMRATTTGTVVAALFATIVAFWGRNPRLAGVALGCLACKPHLAIAPAALALCLGAWRVLAAAAATVALSTAASLAMFGAGAWPAWLAAPLLLALLAAAFARTCQDARPNATSLVATVPAVRPGAAW